MMTVQKNDRKWFLTKVKKACREFSLIDDGDKIAVGLSGGKDSSTLLYIMRALQWELPVDFEVKPLIIDMGWGMNLTPLKDFCSSLGYELTVIKTEIAKIIFDVRKEKNPCALCAKMCRGALHDAALELGCKKVALGHHLDDVIETYFMNLIFTGKMATFHPKSFLDRKGITLIRPMVFLQEKTTSSVARNKGLPILESPCPANKNTKREEMKELVEEYSKRYPDFRHKFLTALRNFEPDSLWKKVHI